jgi:choline dehydrogenase-like flavoprotein
MHNDARVLPNNSLIEGDICIIGSGAAGISIAMDWINTPYKVILLEGGGFEYDDKIQELYAGKTTGQRYYPLKSARLHYFGGTTGHWAGFCSTFDDIDFEKRDYIPHSGWPITKKDLDPYYIKAHKNIELGPYEYDWKYWQKQNPPGWDPLFKDDSVIWNKIWQFSPPTRFGTKYRDTIVKASNIHLYTYANVVDIAANENVSAIKEVMVKNYTGKQHIVRAKQFIVACCSIQNARILLASNQQAPKGLGNDNDNVGRYFMEHLEIKSAEMTLVKPDPLNMYGLDYGTTKARCELSVTPAMQRKHKILNGTSSLTPWLIASKITPMIDVWSTNDPKKNQERMFDGFGRVARETANIPAEKLTKSYELYTRIEQAPNPNSRVTLDTEKDSLGMPRANLHWELTPLEKHSLRKIYELIGQEMGKAGNGRVRLMDYLKDPNDHSWPEFTGGGWHHMGTTRMSDDPKTGVVDKNCKVHGIANLHIAGASCYATAAASNPTLTCIALSLRLSDHLKTLI